MSILTPDIKLLKSAVMADTTDGGGQMTGLEVIDGQSNNLFPDTGSMDRALGRVNMRKLFGVAHTADTDTLLSAHAIIIDAPDDPLVHCALMKTSNWADNRTAARDVIERYVTKGPRLALRIYDAHYAGSLTLRLYTFVVGATLPAGGEAIVLRNPNGAEQYVRILRASVKTELIALWEGNSTISAQATVVTCDLGQPLASDVVGAAVYRSAAASGIVESSYASVYSTSVALGAKFYGVKPLGVAGEVGDMTVMTAGGIYTPIVPAATIETPIIDQFPLLGRSAITPTALIPLPLASISTAIGPNTVLTLPTGIECKSLSLLFGTTAFTDTGEYLQQGTTKVATIDYSAGKIAFLSDCPSYGTQSLTVTYRVATSSRVLGHSTSREVTIANQGLSFVDVLEPPPSPGSLSYSYLAQGRWYELVDNANGKVANLTDPYGTGTLNYATGSMAVTLAAVPDVGSMLLAQWGDKSSVTPLSGTLPANLTARLAVPARTVAAGITLAWSNGSTNYAAATDANGVLSGNATGSLVSGVLEFTPTVFPSGPVTINSSQAPVAHTAATGSGLNYVLSEALPLRQGSVSFSILVSFPADAAQPATTLSVWDSGGVLYTRFSDARFNGVFAVGSINYTTGAVTLVGSVSMQMMVKIQRTALGGNYIYHVYDEVTASVGITGATGFNYSTGTPTTSIQSIAVSSWGVALNASLRSLVPSSVAFKLGGELYVYNGAGLQKGWNPATGAATVANVGVVSTEGYISVTALPTNMANALVWYSVAVDSNPGLIDSGVFRTSSTPLKTGVFQLQHQDSVGNGNDAGILSGGDFTGTVDYTRGLVQWVRAETDPALLSYNAVFLEYLPLDATLLGIDTARLPLDGKVPIYRSTDLVVVHNTLATALPNPLVKGTTYDLGRERLASVRVKDASGVVVPDTLYTTDLNLGNINVPVGSNITAYPHPWAVEHRIEDMLLCSQADISGRLRFTRSLTHDFPANTSFVSSVLPFGDLFARAYSLIEQGTWTSVWADALIGSPILAQFNDTQYPIAVTNAGAIKERWVLIFTNTTSFRVVGESVGEIGTGNTATACAPVNPATGVPYFTLPALGWGSGWAAGNCLRFNTDACGAPFWAVRTVLQGPASLDSDKFTLAFRGDVDRT